MGWFGFCGFQGLEPRHPAPFTSGGKKPLQSTRSARDRAAATSPSSDGRTRCCRATGVSGNAGKLRGASGGVNPQDGLEPAAWAPPLAAAPGQRNQQGQNLAGGAGPGGRLPHRDAAFVRGGEDRTNDLSRGSCWRCRPCGAGGAGVDPASEPCVLCEPVAPEVGVPALNAVILPVTSDLAAFRERGWGDAEVTPGVFTGSSGGSLRRQRPTHLGVPSFCLRHEGVCAEQGGAQRDPCPARVWPSRPLRLRVGGGWESGLCTRPSTFDSSRHRSFRELKGREVTPPAATSVPGEFGPRPSAEGCLSPRPRGPRLPGGRPPGEPVESRRLACPRPSSKSQTKPSSRVRGAGAAQISMRLARRRQRGASTGRALRPISFPSRRSTCSFEKFTTSTTEQKLLMENSAGRGGGRL